MKTVKQLNLKENEQKALQQLKQRLLERYPTTEIILYGSKARGDFGEESDIDLLILFDLPLNSKFEEEITRITFDIELEYDVIFGKIIENKEYWNTSIIANAMPLHWNIDKEGIHI
jgi:predicted nucleotidyltransferase